MRVDAEEDDAYSEPDERGQQGIFPPPGSKRAY